MGHSGLSLGGAADHTVEVLAKLEPAALEVYAAALVGRLGDECTAVRLKASRALATLEPPVLASHAAAIMEHLGDSWKPLRQDLMRSAAPGSRGGVLPPRAAA